MQAYTYTPFHFFTLIFKIPQYLQTKIHFPPIVLHQPIIPSSNSITPSSSSIMEQKKTKKPSLATRFLKAPVRIVCKIRDLYVSGMYSCAAGMGGPTGPYTSGLPRSYSTASSRTDDDFAELVRIASTKSLGKRLDPEFLRRQQTGTPQPVPRSQSAAIGRIDEDKACDFGSDFRLTPEMFPRSRSHAVTRILA